MASHLTRLPGKVLARLRRQRDFSVYHCSMQRSATQWFRGFFADPAVLRRARLGLFVPERNFNLREPEDLEALKSIPNGMIVSPLYVRYADFRNMPKPARYRAFYVVRDPRDVILSHYFSVKFSHDVNPFVQAKRELYRAISESEGLSDLIDMITEDTAGVLRGWLESCENDRVRLFHFEELFGESSHDCMHDLLEHCEIDISDAELTRLLDQYSFKKLSGRRQGDEDQHSHYRKGVSGDWANHFTESHKAQFKEIAGPLLVDLGYESDLDW